jgi:hypothetical protein
VGSGVSAMRTFITGTASGITSVIIFLSTVLYGWPAGLISLAAYFIVLYLYYLSVRIRKEVPGGERRKDIRS